MQSDDMQKMTAERAISISLRDCTHLESWLLFAPKATIGLGITSTSNSSSQEEARIAIVAPPSMSCSRANFCLDSPSPIYHSSVLPSDSTRLSRTPKSEPYKSIDFVRSNSKTTILDEVAILASKCRGASDTNVFSTTSRVKLPFSVSASGSIFKRYSGLGLGAPPTRRRDSACGDSGASPCWDDDNAILGMPSTFLALQRIVPTASKPKRHSLKQSIGLGLGHPPSGSLRAIPPLVSSPTTSLKPLGIGMLASSLSVSSDLYHYKGLAKERKEEHARAYPGYKYKPRRSKRGKKADGRKKTGASVAQISMDEQSFYHPSPNSTAAAPGPHFFLRRLIA
ncbi:hypothetical protein ARMGADRAFT_1167371 [Armillaria gallica]|uniref:HMG box domain-containing protein n=1 Tax=Armillaria gallica TaxID=47427 RepID=A0A2H3D2T9_ARMGA|nr:hypothetical protein ARMGADRAFT_1167371 [Armillaria gallica]